MILRNFAVLEGCDGSGTTTQLDLLKRRFFYPADYNPPDPQPLGLAAAEPEPLYGLPELFTTCEPTRGPAGLLVRRILRGEERVEKETLARLFAADRGEHLYTPGGIVEQCRRGNLVVSDRYTPSSLVYQGLECGPALPAALNADFPLPELLVYLDVDPETAMERIAKRDGMEREIYEHRDFQKRVREAYLELLPCWEKAGVHLLSLDGKKPPEELSEEIWRAVGEMPIMQGWERTKNKSA